MTTVKVFKQGHSMVIAIPRYFLSTLKLGKGDVMVVDREDDALVFRKLSRHNARVREAEAALTAPRRDAKEATE